MQGGITLKRTVKALDPYSLEELKCESGPEWKTDNLKFIDIMPPMFDTLEFYTGKEIDFDSLARRMTEFGYRRQEAITAPGEFAIRGSVVDIFPLHFSLPVRLELLYDTIDSIHTFDPASGERMEPHRMVLVMPVRSEHAVSKMQKGGLSFITDYASPVDPFIDIELGDLVVHILHGIARYRGLKAIPATERGGSVHKTRSGDGSDASGGGRDDKGRKVDHFTLEFADKNILYVPTRDLNLIQKYVAFGKISPELSRLGSRNWDKLKEKAKKGVLSFAAELLDMQAHRRALQGHAFEKDTEWQVKLESEFPYELTDDQKKALSEVKADLESTMPMDRLLCGDVGFGKTEVALRAAFKAAMGGKQVAMLVPTTLLAEQHYDTFVARMKNFPLRVGMLSRFRTPGQQKAVLKGIAEGTCDIVVGTHRLLSKDVAFKDLGLVVIDEEQRFGVRHKEHLKRLRLLVDVLTLTATPIPRTLYMSLVGARDLSTINTPPRNRKPVETVVLEWNDETVRSAVLRELQRKGQAFFVHNRVQGIEHVAKKFQELVPEARVAVGHGQMPARELESVMKRFVHGDIDVLVCTTIVESGIDIPNANTLLVNRADLFGLSELYQLRGRVGRFNRNAYAYLFIPKNMELTEESQKRLRAIERFTYLGSGFSLAMEDLEIRGAGNILGTEQSGYIAGVGFDLYCRILKETVEKLGKTRQILGTTEPRLPAGA